MQLGCRPSPSLIRPRCIRCHWKRAAFTRRTYAFPAAKPPGTPNSSPTTTSRNEAVKEGDGPILIWPTPPSKVNPYSIFNLQRKAAYNPQTKIIFYRLAKLYHPDRRNRGDVERFRLVVAAHDILSDPTKKSAYDRFGAGWDGADGVIGQKEAANGGRPGDRKSGMYGPDTPFANATWDDWYYWHKRQQEKTQRESGEAPQQPVRQTLIDDRTFFVLLFLSVGALGYMLQFSRLESQQTMLVEDRAKRNSHIRRELDMLRRERMAMGTKDERVQNFLRVRDPESIEDPRGVDKEEEEYINDPASN